MTELRYSCNIFGVDSAAGFAETCRRMERLGYDSVFVGDHLGMPAPFPALVAAASATERLRVGTLVLNAPFWNAALLAREIATTDVLTSGRLELGLGSGHMKWEFDAAGIPWEPFGVRADGLASLIDELNRLFADPGYAEQAAARDAFGMPLLRPTQRIGFGGHGPPLIVGGTGDRLLRLAGATADIISVAGVLQVPGQPAGTLRTLSAEEADERIAFARACAGDRADSVEWHTLLQAVLETDDREATARTIAEQFGTVTAEQVLQTPFALLGTVDEMAQQLRAHRGRYGFTYFSVHGPYAETFARVMDRIRELDAAAGSA